MVLSSYEHYHCGKERNMLPDVIESFSPNGIIVQTRDGQIEVKYQDLIRVTIQTTDEGPFLPDCFWLLITNTLCVAIANDDPLIHALLSVLQELPGFKNDLVLKAMASTTNNDFVVWKK